MIRLVKTVLLALVLGATFGAVAAQESRQIPFASPPEGWEIGNFRGYAYATPPGWQAVERSDDGVTLFGGDMQTQTGPAFGLMLERDPMDVFTPGTTTPAGEAVFARGLRFSVLHTTETPEAGITVEAEVMISVDPILRGAHLVILQSAYRQPLDDHRAVLAQILATLDLPAPGVLPLEPALAGAYAAPVPAGWETGSYMDSEVLIFENPDVQGAFKLMRHGARFDPGLRSDWYMPDGTAGQPALFLGQKAVVFEWSKRSKDYHDAADSDEITRLYIFEACLPGGDVASVEVTGLPSFYADPQVSRLLDQVELRLGEGADACPASALPAAMVTGQADAARRQDSGFAPPTVPTAAPVTAADSGPMTALDGLLGYQQAEGFVTMTAPDSVTFMAEDGRGYLTVAKGAGVLAPNGIAALVPPGRQSSYEQGFMMEWSVYGWPSSGPEFIDNGALTQGWHMVQFARSCLAGQIPVAVMFGGTERFTSGDAIKQIKNNLDFNWPAGMEPCVLENAGVENPSAGVLGPVTAAPAPEKAIAPEPAPDVEQSAVTEQAAAPEPQTALPPPPPAPVAKATPDPDSFADQGGGYSLYQNARFGSEISYPSDYFTAESPPDNGDGRRFVSADTQSYFLIFGQHDVFGLSQDEMMQQDKSTADYDDVAYEKSGQGWYVLSGNIGDAIFYRKVVLAPYGIIHVFEIRYPASLKAAFDPVVSHMAQSFAPAAVVPDAQVDPAPPQASIFTPARNTELRAALMDAARKPIEQELGAKVIFVVSVLQTDGTWAYLQAEPRNPDGSKINWSKTPFAHEMSLGVMSDVAMVLMQNTGSGWQVVDHVMGPTDVYWLGWLDPYGLPKSLFTE
ncbi:MAG: hypothetical protein WCC57_16035 [Paracoccaceae bacterium]